MFKCTYTHIRLIDIIVQVTFDGPSEKKVQIKGSNCMDKKWVIKTWKAAPDGNWVCLVKYNVSTLNSRIKC